ncbi:hypothetical protein CROQUDRAFT_92819 [Cronartium quercuum f. sp. fusiforme G11]|uniref:Uncharacterized protein n=1 Tax=Cronartium quercuum f. sp. fusiforme G11 TaxID=708437 RepID=A0A9P6NLS7_9BASI|nr:hypothetical protein CROQUDRAFT_92819 [Cronartium quercuum f. sp. fusiforme G11]
MNTSKAGDQETNPLSAQEEVPSSPSHARTRSGCLPSRHTHSDHTSPLGNILLPGGFAECGIDRQFVKPKPHKRRPLISEDAKDYWMYLSLVADITNAKWPISTPRVLTLSIGGSDADGTTESPRGTSSRPQAANQGALGFNTSLGGARTKLNEGR